LVEVADELVHAWAWCEPDAGELPRGAGEVAWGALGVGTRGVARGDRREVLRLDSDEIANVRGRRGDFPGAELVLFVVPAD